MSPLDLTPIQDDSVTFVEGRPHAAVMGGARDGARVLEACFSARARAALLYAENLPPGFFDVGSAEAGAILQQFRNYGVRLAVVLRGGGSTLSGRAADMVAEERRGRYFGVFESRDDALAWLRS
jgi:hypothetical protein